MKNLLFLLASLLSLPVFAQKVDLDAEPVTVRYVRLPRQPFPAAYQTYSAVLSANPKDLQSLGIADYFFTNNLKVSGYQKVKTGGHFNLDLTLSDYKSGKTESKINTTQEKDKAGKVTERKTYYYAAEYEHSLTLQVRNEEGKVIGTRDWLLGMHTFKSREFERSADLADYYRTSLGRDMAQDDQQRLSAAMREIYAHLNAQYGYPEVSEQPKLQILDSEKHPDFAGFQQAYQTAKSAMALMKADLPLDSVRQLLQPALAYFSQQKDKYDAEDKGQRKLKYACLYNLALLSFWVEDWDKAAENATAVVTNDYDPKDGKRLLEDIQEVRTSLEKTGKTTRHLQFKASEETAATAPEVQYQSTSEGRKDDYKRESLGLTPNTVQYEGSITGTNGTETKVLFLVENPRAVGLAFGYSGNVRYAIDLGPKYDIGRLDKGKIAAFSFDGRNFSIQLFKSANTAALSSSKTVLETVYESPKIKAFLAYSGDSDGLNNPPEYVIQRVEGPENISLNGMKFALNLNKGIKKVFANCPAAVEAADQDGFKRNADDVIKLAKMLEACPN